MGFERKKKPDIEFVTMTQYEEGLPVAVALPKPPKMNNILGAYASELDWRNFVAPKPKNFLTSH